MDPHREYSDLAVEVDDLEKIPELLERSEGLFKIAFHNDQLNDDFPILCNVAYAIGGLHFVVDEADWFCTPHEIPPEFDRIIKYGRHRNITLCCASRRPSEMHRNITANAWECFAFSLQEPRDLDYLKVYAGEEFTASLPHLPTLEGRRANLANRDDPILAFRLTPGPGGGSLIVIGQGRMEEGAKPPSMRFRHVPSSSSENGQGEGTHEDVGVSEAP